MMYMSDRIIYLKQWLALAIIEEPSVLQTGNITNIFTKDIAKAQEMISKQLKIMGKP
jgi:hypothetical protein